jgi:hypothetical protein
MTMDRQMSENQYLDEVYGDDLEADLQDFTGTLSYYQTSIPRIYSTDGVQYLAEHAKAYWLIDAIASHQFNSAVRAEGFQVWTLHVGSTQEHPMPQSIKAILICDDGNGRELTRQNIPYTDFPLPQIKLYCCDGDIGGKSAKIIMLPTEY